MNADAVVQHVLPRSLITSDKWHSEFVHDSASTPIDGLGTRSYATYGDEERTIESAEVYHNPVTTATMPTVQHMNTSIGTAYANQDDQEIIRRIEHEQPPPMIVHRKLADNLVTYQQNISVRYLRPPSPPPPGPLIIREVYPPAPPLQPPIQIRQRAPAPPTPPPLVLREQPPPLPPRAERQVIDKLLPAPPRPPRRVIVERFASCPPKPSDVVIERWLPYKSAGQRRVLIERAPFAYTARQEPNLLILHDQPHARVHKEFINNGVVRMDPGEYVQRYGSALNSWESNPQHAYLAGEAFRAVPPPSSWENQMRSTSPFLPRSSSFDYGYSHYNTPHRSSYYGDRYDSYPTRYDDHLSMTDVTPSWNQHCRSSSHDPYSSSSMSYPSEPIRARSEEEFQRILANLTHGRLRSTLYSY